MQIKLQDFYLSVGVLSFSELLTGLLRQDSKTDNSQAKRGGGAEMWGRCLQPFPTTLSPRRYIKATQPINYSPEHLPAPTRSLCTLA